MRTIKRNELMARLGNMVKVENTIARCGYGKAPNQFKITFENGVAFQSYNSLIAIYYMGEWYFTRFHDYSNTTCRHLKNFCNLSTDERRRGLEDGTYIFIEG